MNVVAELADRVTVLAAGRVLADGSYDEVRADPRVIDAYLGAGRPCCPELTASRLRPVAYGDAFAVRDVSLQVRAGEIVTLCGRNGAGKTTLLRAIMGLHPPTAGTIELDGVDVASGRPHRAGPARARLGAGRPRGVRHVSPSPRALDAVAMSGPGVVVAGPDL